MDSASTDILSHMLGNVDKGKDWLEMGLNLTPGKQNLHCIACDVELENIGGENCLQPNDGMAFQSRGHYGTTFFDPCTGDYIEIVVCDKCLQKRFGIKHI